MSVSWPSNRKPWEMPSAQKRALILAQLEEGGAYRSEQHIIVVGMDEEIGIRLGGVPIGELEVDVPMRDMEEIIDGVNDTMALSGMPLTDGDKETLRAVLRGDISFQEMRNSILADYLPISAEHEQS